MSREVMKLALEALQLCANGEDDVLLTRKALKALQEALAQPDHPKQMARLGWQYVECPACGSEGARAFPKPEQEHVAWMLGDDDFQDARCYVGVAGDIPLYTSPPQRQTLTDEEIAEVAERMEAIDAESSFWREFARAIEAVHGIKELK